MKVTVAICTWNRAEILDRTLDQLCRVHVPLEIVWELLIVNNNCTDHTDLVIDKYASTLPVHREFESQQGVSHARNRAIEAASGELLLWTDDDVLVDAGWLHRHIEAFARFPDAAYSGGRIRPWYHQAPPRWITQNLEQFGRAFALKDYGDSCRWLSDSEIIITANMGCRTEVLRRYRFDARLGRTAQSSAGCEDHELVSRMKEDGLQGIWIGDAIVDHYIPPNRMTKRWIWNWWSDQAALYVTRFPMERERPELFGAPRWMLRKYWEARLRMQRNSLFQNKAWAVAFMDAAWLHGMIKKYRSNYSKCTQTKLHRTNV